MSIKQETSVKSKIMLINLDQNQSQYEKSSVLNDISQNQTVIVSEDIKCQRIQINSLEAFQTNLSYNQQKSNKINKRTVSPKKKLNSPALKCKSSNNQNSLSSSDIQSISELGSMNQSSFQLVQDKKNSKINDQYDQVCSNQEQKPADSPQKLKKKYKKMKKIPVSISLLCPPKQLWTRCYQFMDKIYTQIQEQTNGKKSLMMIQQFVHSPLPVIQNSYMRYVFQIHLFKYTFTFHTCYEFYLRNSYGQMIHLLRSQKDSFTTSSSHLLYATNPHKSTDKQFTAKLKYNTVKSQYNLYDVDQKQSPQHPRRLLATGFYDKPIGNQRDIKFYVPKTQFLNNDFIKSEQNKNLKAFYNESESPIYRQVQILRTAPIPKQNEMLVRDQFELKNEGRCILIKNEQKQQRMYMGKKQNERYIVIVGGGMTPLQAFSLAILNLDH